MPVAVLTQPAPGPHAPGVESEFSKNPENGKSWWKIPGATTRNGTLFKGFKRHPAVPEGRKQRLLGAFTGLYSRGSKREKCMRHRHFSHFEFFMVEE
jgi:hypothetical protein